MNTTESTPIRIVPNTTDVQLNAVTVGKDILELITGAMYINPLDIYREYIQNAADSLDQTGRSTGNIEIEIDVGGRAVVIRDNGLGVPNDLFVKVMTAIGGSEKRGTNARGFRGVGRLSGLGYCRELYFRSKAENEAYLCEIRWDGKRFRDILRDTDYQEGLAQVVQDVTHITKTGCSNIKEPVFEVELRGLARLQNDVLLNADLIRDYLAQVAPVPFHPDFCFAHKIHSKLEEFGVHAGYEISIAESGLVESSKETVYRPHGSSFHVSRLKMSDFSSVRFIRIPGIEKGIDAFAWIADHEYLGAIHHDQLIKGLRFRTGNIQVGGHDIAESWFPESRFNSWIVGEVHVLSRKIAPNGRRDNFETSAHLSNLQTNLTPELRGVAQRCRRESAKRQFMRRFESLESEVYEDLKLLESGNIAKRHRSRLSKEIDQKVLDLDERAQNQNYGLSELLNPRVAKLRNNLYPARNRKRDDDDPLSVVPYAKRLAFQEVFELIYRTAPNKPVANGVVEKLVKRLAEKYGANARSTSS